MGVELLFGFLALLAFLHAYRRKDEGEFWAFWPFLPLIAPLPAFGLAVLTSNPLVNLPGFLHLMWVSTLPLAGWVAGRLFGRSLKSKPRTRR